MPRHEGLVRYNVSENRADGAVLYDVKTGRNGKKKAFRLRVSGSQYGVNDTWPLRREIARHAGVDPDDVFPDWDDPTCDMRLGRLTPWAWYARTDPSAPPPGSVTTELRHPDTYPTPTYRSV